MANSFTFSQPEKNEFLVELTSTGNYFLDKENRTDSFLLFEDSLLLISYTTPTLVSDGELNYQINFQLKKTKSIQ